MLHPGAFGKAALNYEEQEILSESPLALIARLYHMASLEVSRARAGIQARDWATKGQAIWRASRCISLLQCSLKRDEGGEVAANLDKIYEYMLRRISEAHAHNDDGILEEVATHLVELGSAWREAANREEVRGASAAPVDGKPSLAAVAT